MAQTVASEGAQQRHEQQAERYERAKNAHLATGARHRVHVDLRSTHSQLHSQPCMTSQTRGLFTAHELNRTPVRARQCEQLHWNACGQHSLQCTNLR